jgi:hypothetical protein
VLPFAPMLQVATSRRKPMVDGKRRHLHAPARVLARDTLRRKCMSMRSRSPVPAIRSERSSSMTSAGSLRENDIMDRFSRNELPIFIKSALMLFAGAGRSAKNEA